MSPLTIRSIAAMMCSIAIHVGGQQSSVTIASFDGSIRTWEDTNDPVMGGQSTSTFKTMNGTGIFDGDARIVPSLKAPGFCKSTGLGSSMDLSNYVNGAMVITARTSTPDYAGFKVAFGGKNVPKTSIFGGGSYKTDFNVTSATWQNITIPLRRFSYDWSGYTGRCDTKDPSRGVFPGQQHYCCDREPSKEKVCPQPQYLSEITEVALWAEGVAGNFHLEVSSIVMVSAV